MTNDKPKKDSSKPKRPLKWYHHTLITLGILVGGYFLFTLLLFPLYTRHWQRIEVPNVNNLSYRAAEKLLQEEKLQVVRAEEKFDDFAPPGFVIFQNPPAQRPVKNGRRIYLTVSKGNRSIKMPKLVGQSERDVRFTLERMQLQIGRVEYEFDSFYPPGVIMEQSFEEGEEIEVGSEVNLLISLGEPPDDHVVPNLVGRLLDDAKLELKKAQLTLGSISTHRSTKFDDDVVIYQSKEAGLTVGRRDTVNIVVNHVPVSAKEAIPW